MGAPIYTDDVIRVAFEGTVGARQWSNIVHYKFSGGGPSVGDLTTMGDALAGDWESLMTPYQDADTALTGVKLTDLTSALSAQTTIGADLVGTRTGAYLPASASVLVTYDVAVRYRGGHPRNYISVGVQAEPPYSARPPGRWRVLPLHGSRARTGRPRFDPPAGARQDVVVPTSM